MRSPDWIHLTGVLEWQQGQLRRYQDYLVNEEPLEIRVNDDPVSVTLRTPGHDVELALGFLFTEGVLEARSAIAEVREENASRGSTVQVVLQPDARWDPAGLARHFYTTSSCGVCGKAAIEAVRRRGLLPPDRSFRVGAEVLASLPERLRQAQTLFDRTGGLHAAALFDASGRLEVVREDVGRHNAVDKVIGWALLRDRLPLARSVLLVSGRGGFEIVQKAIAAGLPVLACVSAPSSLAVRLAREFSLTLVGFLRGSRFVVYAGEERLIEGPAENAEHTR